MKLTRRFALPAWLFAVPKPLAQAALGSNSTAPNGAAPGWKNYSVRRDCGLVYYAYRTINVRARRMRGSIY
jgi:hypothetical protein